MIFHYGSYFDNIEKLLSLKSKKILFYHNYTPACFFENYNPELSTFLKKSRNQLIEISGLFDSVIVPSNYNKSSLLNHNFKNEIISVIPYMIKWRFVPLNLMKKLFYVKTLSPLRMIYAGRIEPHKRIEKIILLFNIIAEKYFQDCELHLIGPYDENSKYYAELKELIKFPSKVFFHGRKDYSEVFHYYSTADVYLNFSEHEGFCIPVIEAAASFVPVISNNIPAVADNVKGKISLVDNEDYQSIAELILKIKTEYFFRIFLILRQIFFLDNFIFSETKFKFKNQIMQ
ncbi:MAG TPA: glycosyltransferase family 4 protein [bacterium]|nr:glycosyltransferase family 4 protein [bacterium]